MKCQRNAMILSGHWAQFLRMLQIEAACHLDVANRVMILS